MSTPINTNALRKAIQNFQFYSTPSNGSHNEPCTVGDIHKLIDNTAKLFNAFVDEIENAQ